MILAGDPETGLTLHEMVDAFDAGDVVGQVRFPVAPRETATTLYEKSLAASRVLLRKVVPLIQQDRTPLAPQDEVKATVVPAAEPRRPRPPASVAPASNRHRARLRPSLRGARVPAAGRR